MASDYIIFQNLSFACSFVFIIFVFTLFFIVFLLKTKPLWVSKPHGGLPYSVCLYGIVFWLDLAEYCDNVKDCHASATPDRLKVETISILFP